MNTSFDESGQRERLISLLRKFEQELLEDNKEKKKSKKWFDWHWFPEEPIKLSSVVEMTVFLLICIGSFFLYYRWNVVPNKEFEIQIEDLSDGVVYDSTQVRVDSVRRVFACEINYNIPMTRHEEFTEGLNACILNINPLYSDDKYSEFMKYTFLNDSLRNNLNDCLHNNLNDNKSNAEDFAKALLKKYNLTKEFESIDRFRTAFNKVKAYKKDFLDLLNVPQDSFVMAISLTKQSLPFLTQSIMPGMRNGNNLISDSYYSDDKKYYHVDTYFYFDNKTIKSIKEPQTKISTIQDDIKFSTTQKFLRFFNIFRPFVTGGTMTTPPWGRLEDISQAYINLKLESYTIDSIVLNLNFIGATEFSQMDPIPDKVGMSNIIFNDPVKIYKIKANGLRFHARFIELENWQQIRVFTVTAIMSAFVLVFVVFAISAYFKIRKKIQENGGRNMHKYIYWTYIVLAGFILYAFFYWTFMCFAIDIEEEIAEILIYNIPIPVGVIKCNIITIPIVLIILLLSNRKGRRTIVKIINNELFKKITIFVSICLFIVLLCFALYKVLNMDFDILMKDQKYRRATKQIYSDIFYKNKATKDDERRLRQALLASNGPVQETIDGVYKDDLFASYVYGRDSLVLYDLQNNSISHYMIPEIREVTIYDSFVVVRSVLDHYYIIIKNKQQYKSFDIGHHKGKVIGLTNDKKAIIFYEEDMIKYKSLSNGSKYLYISLDDNKIKEYLETVVGDYVITAKLDSFYIYKLNNLSPYFFNEHIINCNNSFVSEGLSKLGIKTELKFDHLWNKELDFCYKSKSKKENIKFLNTEENLLLYKNNDIDYIVDLTPGENYIDSLPKHYWETEIKPSHLWNRNTLNVLKKASAENNICYMGIDHSNIYLFNFQDTCVEAYNWRGILIKKRKTNHYSPMMPILYSEKKGTFFVQKISDSIYYKYNMNGLVDTKPVKRYAKNSYINDYLIEENNDQIIVRPFANPSDSFVVMNKNNFAGSYGIIKDDIHIINGWMLRRKGNDNYYIENIRSTDSLILNSKYLTKGQKNRLIEILKREKKE